MSGFDWTRRGQTGLGICAADQSVARSLSTELMCGLPSLPIVILGFLVIESVWACSGIVPGGLDCTTPKPWNPEPRRPRSRLPVARWFRLRGLVLRYGALGVGGWFWGFGF